MHRIGRTGRAGAVGTAYTFFTPGNYKLAHELVGILSEAGQEVPPQLAAMRSMFLSLSSLILFFLLFSIFFIFLFLLLSFSFSSPFFFFSSFLSSFY